MTRLGPLLVVIAVTRLPLAAQQTAPAFETASIKPSKSVATYPTVTGRSPDRYALSNASLIDLIREAYRVRASSVVDGPDWARRERFDIVAVARASSRPQHPAMLQRLLAQRFALRMHRETRQLPVYELVRARSDGRLGSNLREVTVDCAKEPCRTQDETMSFRSNAVPWPPDVFTLGLDRPVIDKTGLKGQVEINLRWAPDDPTDTTPEQVSLFTAVQEQLGLKLQPATGPVEVIVIDSVERPTPD